MLSVPKSRSKDRKAGKGQKTPLKSTAVLNGGSGHNPQLGTCRTLDAFSISLTQMHDMGGSENHDGATHGSGCDYDSAWNNDSRNVESEERSKEKSIVPNKQEAVLRVDNDKREKIRQKNERKHQRQKEKRAEELHERCCGYLMSRKLETLAQQLVDMGFSHDRSTIALMLNEGRVEEAVAWLFEGGEESNEHKNQNLVADNTLKIDVSEEIARISEMEVKFKCSKQEVERAIVSCEGNLEKSEEVLRSLKQVRSAAPLKPGESGDPSTFSDGKISVATSPSNVKPLQPKRSVVGLGPKSVRKPVQPLTSVQPKLEWGRPQRITSGSVRESVVITQKTHSASAKQVPVTGIGSSALGAAVSWYSSSSEVMKLDGSLSHIPSTRSASLNSLTPNHFYDPTQNQQQYQAFLPGSSPMNNLASNRVNDPFSTTGSSPTQAFMLGISLMDNSASKLISVPSLRMGSSPIQAFMSGSCPVDNSVSYRVDEPFSRMVLSSSQSFMPGSSPIGKANDPFPKTGASPTLPPASSLGPSSVWSPVDWSASTLLPSCDNTSIDRQNTSFLSSNSNRLCVGSGLYSRSNVSGRSAMDVNLGLGPPRRSGASMTELQGGREATGPSAASPREWTSPFEEKDLFSLPRQLVFSPSF